MVAEHLLPLHRLFTSHSGFRWLTLLLGMLLIIGAGESKDLFSLPESLLQSVESQYGNSARRRLVAWQSIIRDDTAHSDQEKLEKVNSFFNQLRFVNDKKLWGKSDYWATPVEFLSLGGGDCEDFALAKYFTLKALGIAEEKLNMTYVKALQLNQAHMVVTYYAVPNAVPLVLDNLEPDIKPATSRSDLLPVYSFNGTGLWLAKARGKGQMVGGSDRLRRWQDLLSRMPEGLN